MFAIYYSFIFRGNALIKQREWKFRIREIFQNSIKKYSINDNTVHINTQCNNNNGNSWWEETWWSDTRCMAEQQVFSLGRNYLMPTSWILRHWVRPRGRCLACRFSQTRKVCPHQWLVPLYAHRGRKLGPSAHVSTPTLCKPWQKDFLKYSRNIEVFCSRAVSVQ